MKLPRFDEWEPLYVEWQDACRSAESWGKLKKSDVQVDGCVSVGMVHSQDSIALVLVQSRDPDTKNVVFAIAIPVCAITAFKRLA